MAVDIITYNIVYICIYNPRQKLKTTFGRVSKATRYNDDRWRRSKWKMGTVLPPRDTSRDTTCANRAVPSPSFKRSLSATMRSIFDLSTPPLMFPRRNDLVTIPLMHYQNRHQRGSNIALRMTHVTASPCVASSLSLSAPPASPF